MLEKISRLTFSMASCVTPPMWQLTGSLTHFSERVVNSVTSILTLAKMSALWFDSTSIPC